jgi:D-arabinose 1-dehydrogenase-like Zn-dependent alcohol dehydrogenase
MEKLQTSAAVAVKTVPHGVTGRAAVIAQPGRIEMKEIKFRDPVADEVRIRLEGCGVSASNIPVWQGKPWFTYPLEPGAPGHEGWGRVDAVGPNADGIVPGERVAFLSSHAYAEYDISKSSELIKLPSSMDSIPFPGEPLGCVTNIIKRSAILPGDTVAIVGIAFLGALLTHSVAVAIA